MGNSIDPARRGSKDPYTARARTGLLEASGALGTESLVRGGRDSDEPVRIPMVGVLFGCLDGSTARRRVGGRRGRRRTLRLARQAAVRAHAEGDRCRQRGAALRRHSGLRRGAEGLHRRAGVLEGRRSGGQRRLGPAPVRLLPVGHRLPERPSLAAAHLAPEHEGRPVRSDPGLLPGARLRPRERHLRRGRDWLDRVRPADGTGARSRGEEARGRAPRREARGGRRLLPLPRRSLGRRARPRRRGRRAGRQGHDHRAARLHGPRGVRERLRRQRDEPPRAVPVRHPASREPVRTRRPGPEHERGDGQHRADRAHARHRGRLRGPHHRWREDGVHEHAGRRGALAGAHLVPRPQGLLDRRGRDRRLPQRLHAARRSRAQPAPLVAAHQPGALPLRHGRGRDDRVPPLAALGQRARPGGAARPAGPVRQHDQLRAVPREPGRDHQPDPQRLRDFRRGSQQSWFNPRLPRLAGAQQPCGDQPVPRLLGWQPGDPDSAFAGGLGAALCRG